MGQEMQKVLRAPTVVQVAAPHMAARIIPSLLFMRCAMLVLDHKYLYACLMMKAPVLFFERNELNRLDLMGLVEATRATRPSGVWTYRP